MKKLILWIFSLLVMLVALAVAVPLLVPAEEYKSAALAWLKKSTGREVNIEGDISFALFPDIALQLDGVTIGNPSGGFTSPYLAKIGRLDLSVKLAPLFAKQVEVDALTLGRPEIWLEETTTGARNWEVKFAKSGKESDASGAEPQKGGKDFRFDIGRVEVALGTLHLLRKKEHYEAKEISANWQGDSLAFSSAVKLRGVPLKVKLRMDKALSFINGSATPIEFAAVGDVLGVALKGDVKMDGSASGSLAIESSSTQELGKALGMDADLPDGALRIASDQVQLSAKGATLPRLDLRWGETELRGNVTADWGSKTPSVKGEVSAEDLVLSNFSTQAEGGGAPAAANAPSSGWSTNSVDFSGLEHFNADLRFTLGRLMGDSFQLHDIAGKAVNKGGKLRITLDKASMLGGVISGKAGVDASNHLQIEGKVQHLAVEEALKLAMDKSRITGTLESDFAFTASGKSQAEWMKRLQGGGNVSMRDGVIKGYALPQLFRNLRAEAAENNTKYTEIAVKFVADAGVLNLQEANLRAPSLAAEVGGKVDMGNRRVDLTLKPKLVPQFNSQNIEGGESLSLLVPLKVTGPFEDVSVKPDLKAAVSDALSNPDQAKQNFKALKEEGKSVLKGLKEQKNLIKEDWKGLKEGKSPEALGNLLNQLDQSGLPVPKLFNGLKTQKSPAGPADSGAGTGGQPGAGAGADTGGQGAGQQGTAPDESRPASLP